MLGEWPKKLKDEIIKFSTFLIEVSGENKQLIKSIESSTDVSDRKKKKKTKSWEEYYFYDMPAVGALTLLSKMQSDVRNTEADVIDFLKKDFNFKVFDEWKNYLFVITNTIHNSFCVSK